MVLCGNMQDFTFLYGAVASGEAFAEVLSFLL